jgi:hypothetical protein
VSPGGAGGPVASADVRVALVVLRSMDDAAVRRAAEATYRDLAAVGHEVDCFVVGDPRVVEGFAGAERTQLCVVDDGFRSEQWEGRAPAVVRTAREVMVRVAATRLRALVARADRRSAYDAFVQPRWDQ